jgi:uncharacterized membrane protein YdbT with pleckstrin-like domain
MPYADQLIANGEKIVRREKQHWIFPFYIAGRWVAIAAIVAVIGVVLTQFVLRNDGDGIVASAIGLIDTIVGWVTVIAILIAIVGFAWSVIMWRTQEYVLTNHRVMHVRGVVNKQASDSSLENITDAAITVSWLGRVVGFGNLMFMTAAEGGIESMRALRDPIGFKKQLMELKTERLIEINTPRSAPAAAAPAPAPAAAPAAAPTPAPAAPAAAPSGSSEDVTKTLAALADLRDSGAITPDE